MSFFLIDKLLEMKKLFAILTMTMMVLAACTKEESEQKPAVNNSDNDIRPEEAILGRWNPTENTYFKVMLYYRDGTFCDSIFTDMGETGFNFRSGNQVDTPWEVPATYTLKSDMITFNLMGVVERNYSLLDLTAHHLAFEYLDTSEYTSGEDTLVGYEYEHWDLKK